MFLEILIAFFLILHLRKTLRSFSPDPIWDQRFTIAMYAIAVLALLELLLSIEYVTKWIWHLLLLLIVLLSLPLPGIYIQN